MQQPLTTLQIALADRGRKSLGTMGEMVARNLFLKAGYAVITTRDGEHRGDLVVIDQKTGERYQVEVKTSRRNRDGKWRFTLWKKGCTDHRHSDFVVLLPVLKSGRVVPFIIPTADLEDKHHAVITSHPESYHGRLAVYRQNEWEFRL